MITSNSATYLSKYSSVRSMKTKSRPTPVFSKVENMYKESIKEWDYGKGKIRTHRKNASHIGGAFTTRGMADPGNTVFQESDQNRPKTTKQSGKKNSKSSKEYKTGTRAYIPVKTYRELHRNRNPILEGDKPRKSCVRYQEGKPSKEYLKFNEKNNLLPH